MGVRITTKATAEPGRVLAGQRALVTGGDSGIGEGIVEALAAAGARVFVNYLRGADQAQGLVSRIRDAGGEAFAVQADVSQEHQVQMMFRQMNDTFGGLDILVNNAGVRRDASFVDMSLEDWDHVLRVNLTGQFLCAREAVRWFLRRGVDPEISRSAGKIVCISSVHDAIPWAGHANYAVSKAGVLMMIKTLAQELAMHKVRVNGVSPGAIKTPLNQSIWSTPEREAEVLQLIPYGRMGLIADIARAVVWLACDESDYMTGTTLYVDGGMSLYPGFEKCG